jgi:hypothetical protein
MIAAAHQPHCFPWLGYLHKVARCDVFVVMDDLQFEAQNYQNRNRIKVNNGTTWLTVPLVKGAQSDRICDKRIANDASPKEHWQRKGWLTLTTHYGKAKCFADHKAELEEVFTRPWESLLDLDMHMLRLFTRWLGITTPIVMASSLGLSGDKTDRIIDMCKKVKADVYYSGKGGSTGYLDLPAFERAGIALSWQEFEHPVYAQRYPALGFVKNLAALDLFLNCGAESRCILLGPDAPAGETTPAPAPEGGEGSRGEAIF